MFPALVSPIPSKNTRYSAPTLFISILPPSKQGSLILAPATFPSLSSFSFAFSFSSPLSSDFSFSLSFPSTSPIIKSDTSTKAISSFFISIMFFSPIPGTLIRSSNDKNGLSSINFSALAAPI